MPLSSGYDGIVGRRRPDRKIGMTTKDKVAQRKPSLLEWVTEPSNGGRARKMAPRRAVTCCSLSTVSWLYSAP